MLQYYKEAQDAGVLVRPILNKIMDNTLTLINYSLNPGITKALAAYLENNNHGV